MPPKKQSLDPKILRKFSFFASYSMDQLEELAATAPRISLKKNSVVFRQGERSETMYLILKGGVKIEREDEKGEVFSLGEMSEYKVFGELAMLSKEPRMATVTATTNTVLLAIDRGMMLDIISKSDPEEIIEVFSVLSDQVREANDREFKDALLKRTLDAQMEIEKQRALTQMVAGVAHEINTPLGVINTAVSIMSRELTPPIKLTEQRVRDIAESLDLMSRNIERAHRLVQDFKKVSVSQLSDKLDTVDIVEVLEETISLVMLSLKRSQVQVKFHNKLHPTQRKWTGYRGFLSQVLINLLTNVQRYAYPKGNGIADVTLHLEGDNHFSISVKDYGRGIPKDIQDRVFEPFFTTGRSIGGTGLGLSIVYNLVVNALKGEIKLKSTEGKGAEFIVTFPRVVAE